MTKGKRLCGQILCCPQKAALEKSASAPRVECEADLEGSCMVPHCQRSAHCQSESGGCDCMRKGVGQAQSWSKWP